jgi:hypothetical protein
VVGGGAATVRPQRCARWPVLSNLGRDVQKTTHALPVLLTVIGAAATLSACGVAGVSHTAPTRQSASPVRGWRGAITYSEPGTAIVAEVAGSKITKATLNHWIAIQAITDREVDPVRPAPQGIVPVPPRYSACIGYLARLHEKSTGTLRPDLLKLDCAEKYRELLQHVLDILISFAWFEGEAAQQRVDASDDEVRARYYRFSHERFPRAGELQRYLAITGEKYQDELLRMRMDLLSTRLGKRVTSLAAKHGLTPQQQQQTAQRWYADFVRRWVRKTRCRRDYIVPDCDEYKGPLTPEARL